MASEKDLPLCSRVQLSHSLTNRIIIDTDTGIKFLRTECSSCHKWISDDPNIAPPLGNWQGN